MPVYGKVLHVSRSVRIKKNRLLRKNPENVKSHRNR